MKKLQDETTDALLVIRRKHEAALEQMTANLQEVTAIIEERMARAERDLRLQSRATVSAEGSPRKKRVLSAAARKRIAAAQRKRWAEYKKQEGK